MSVETPSSFAEFSAQNPELTLREYSQKLAEYRQATAAELGVSPDQLHALGMRLVKDEAVVMPVSAG